MLKEEILDWINTQPKGKKFTSADVYSSVDSAEDPAKVSDVLRGLAKSNILNRHEFYEGNKKRFTYWLKEESVARMGGFSSPPSDIIKKAQIFDDSNKGGKSDSVVNVRLFDDGDKNKSSITSSEITHVSIPNNFTLELKTPNGFVITIKSSDIK